MIFAPFDVASSIKSEIYLGLFGSGSGVSNLFSQGKPNVNASTFSQNLVKK